MADKSQSLILEALRQIMAEPAGMPLFAGKSQPGLFAGNAAGKQAARLCQQEGYLNPVRTEVRGRSAVDVCTISEKGLAFLLGQLNPTPVLEAFVVALENRQAQFNELLGTAQASQRYLEELKGIVQKALDHYRQPGNARPQTGGEVNGAGQTPPKAGHAENGRRENGVAPATVLLDGLRHWQKTGSLGDCPLPRLFRSVQTVVVHWTVGQFHDCLRKLHQDQAIYLHPWTGPLYEIPEPSFALLVGHEVAYYASMHME